MLYLCLKNDFVSSGWKKCKEYLALFFFFENDNIWVLDFEIRSLNIKKAVKSFSRGVFNFWMCLQPSIPVIAYLQPPLRFYNLPLISHNHHLQFAETATVPLHPNDHSRYFVCSLLFVDLRTEISLFYCRWLVFIWPLLSYVLLFDISK